MLFIGNPKSGKTRAACGFPKPWVLDTNSNLHSVITAEPTLDLDFDCPTTRNGIELAVEDRWDLAMEQLTAACRNPDYLTIVVDDFGFLVQLLLAKLLKLAKLESPKPITALRIQDYGTMQSTLYNLLLTLKRVNKTFIFTAHQQIDKNENGSFHYELALPSKAAQVIPGLFSDVLGFSATLDGFQYKYRIHTRPTGFHASLGTAFNLPPTVDITDKLPSQIPALLGIK